MENFFVVLALIWSILCLILFFKIWRMTNDVCIIKDLMHRLVADKASKKSIASVFNIGDKLKVKETGEYVTVGSIDVMGSNVLYECNTSEGKKDFCKEELIKE